MNILNKVAVFFRDLFSTSQIVQVVAVDDGLYFAKNERGQFGYLSETNGQNPACGSQITVLPSCCEIVPAYFYQGDASCRLVLVYYDEGRWLVRRTDSHGYIYGFLYHLPEGYLAGDVVYAASGDYDKICAWDVA